MAPAGAQVVVPQFVRAGQLFEGALVDDVDRMVGGVFLVLDVAQPVLDGERVAEDFLLVGDVFVGLSAVVVEGWRVCRLCWLLCCYIGAAKRLRVLRYLRIPFPWRSIRQWELPSLVVVIGELKGTGKAGGLSAERGDNFYVARRRFCVTTVVISVVWVFVCEAYAQQRWT